MTRTAPLRRLRAISVDLDRETSAYGDRVRARIAVRVPSQKSADLAAAYVALCAPSPPPMSASAALFVAQDTAGIVVRGWTLWDFGLWTANFTRGSALRYMAARPKIDTSRHQSLLILRNPLR
ncbi:MAG: hypothetical protein C5B60_04470 [Chloroflexi bacterium]|nr:MAG: hypothetical protein C5B60_04470 [Chloroflexota bacterium]